MNYVGSNSISLKYQGFPPSDCHDIGIRKLEFELLWKIKVLTHKNKILRFKYNLAF